MHSSTERALLPLRSGLPKQFQPVEDQVHQLLADQSSDPFRPSTFFFGYVQANAPLRIAGEGVASAAQQKRPDTMPGLIVVASDAVRLATSFSRHVVGLCIGLDCLHDDLFANLLLGDFLGGGFLL
jgi:hypothetical protein